MQQSRVYVGMILILIFGEVLGLYGYAIQYQETVKEVFPILCNTNLSNSLIVGLILNSKS